MHSSNVVYILLYFPYLTETFIAEEIQAMRSRGINIQIISLLKPKPSLVQPLSQKLLAHTWYAPDVPSLNLWLAQFYFLLKSPRLYWHLLSKFLREPYPKGARDFLIKRFVIFLKAVTVAYHLRSSEAQLLHTHFAWLPGAAAWVSARLLNLPFTVTIHAYDVFSLKNDLLPLVSAEANRIVAISEYNRQYVLGLGTCPVEHTKVIHCGIDLTQFQSSPSALVNDSETNTLKILSVGSLVRKKGHEYLITACHLLKQSGIDFTCTIIGGGDDTKLRRLIEAYDLHDQVCLGGARSQPEIVMAYQQHNLFVLACVVTPDGDRDGIPVVLMEAAAMGLPLVSTDVSGIPEIVRDGETGCLVPAGDATALAEAITGLARNPSLRVSLGKNARALVEAEFSINVNATRLDSLFKETIQQHEQIVGKQKRRSD